MLIAIRNIGRFFVRITFYVGIIPYLTLLFYFMDFAKVSFSNCAWEISLSRTSVVAI